MIVPYSLAHNDGKFVAQTGTAAQWFEFIHDGFDMLRESAHRPRMMSIGMHMRLIGNPSRAVAVERLLDHLNWHRDLWIARRIDIAKHWHALHAD